MAISAIWFLRPPAAMPLLHYFPVHLLCIEGEEISAVRAHRIQHNRQSHVSTAFSTTRISLRLTFRL